MTTDLEAELRTALHVEALDAPLVTPEWPGPTVVVSAPAAPHRAGRLLALAAVLVLALGATSAVLALRPDSAAAPGAHVRPPFVQGDEVTLEPIEPVLGAELPGQVVKPGSVRSYRVGGFKAPLTVYDSALDDAWFRENRCLVLAGATGCIGLPAGGAFLSSDMERGQLGWVGLAPEVAYVQVVLPDGTARWQVPLDGTAVLPSDADTSRTPSSLVAFDIDGNVVAKESFESKVPGTDVPGTSFEAKEPSTVEPIVPDIVGHEDRLLDLVGVGRAALTECLARISARPLPDAAWTACVDEGAAAMLARNAELTAADAP